MLKLGFQLFANSPIWNCPLVCLIVRDSQLPSGFFTEPLRECKFIQNRNNVALQALDVGIRRAIVHHHCRTVLRVVEEVQLVAALGHVDNVLAVQGVLTWP